ncbi:MAG: hypothetical protein IJW40_06005 [Clostridia bacterium]|nr:hypothetical protein [Clostridia bacterium]
MNNSFYTLAYEAMREECRRICLFTDALDKNPSEKKQKIAEYKCAKYRYAAVSNVQARLMHSYRLRERLCETHYLISDVEQALLARADLVEQYEHAPKDKQPEYGLYLGFLAFTDLLIAEHEKRFAMANDWERVELEERLAGYRFARAALVAAWEKRGEADE